MRTLLRVLVVAALAALLARAASAAPQTSDSGSYKVYGGDRPIGIEAFMFQAEGDTIVVTSNVYQARMTANGPDTLHKEMTLVMSAFDWSLRYYNSVQKFAGHKVGHSVVPRDSTFTVFKDVDQAGQGSTFALPPGHFYVLDPGLFSLFDVMCRMLQGRTFETRPLTLLTFGPVDSLIEATVTDRGSETIPFGGRPVLARKLEFSDGTTRFLAWADPQGRMLRLQQPEVRLRVEREPPAIKPRKRPAR